MGACSIKGCGEVARRRGWCHGHYKRWWRYGDPLGVFQRQPLEERFWSKVDKDGPVPDYAPHLGPCWLWTRGLTKGYGTFGMHGKVRYAHIVAYELLVGVVPDGLELDHLCRVPACCNPVHLEPVTHAENIRRGDTSAQGAHWRAKTHCPQGHQYDDANTYVNPTGGRECRICKRASGRRRRTGRVAR
jgi:HNH endonuclease